MITFNIQANNGNFYRGHKPSNDHSNCWTEEQEEALTFTIEQARELAKALGFLKIVIALSAESISESEFKREMFCSMGGSWYAYFKKTKYKHIHFEDIYMYSGRKTKTFLCQNNNTNTNLGIIKWERTWRQYCFYPDGQTAFSKSCLEDICDFIKQLKQKRE